MKTVIKNADVNGTHIDIGVLSIIDGTLTIKDLSDNKLMENCVPVPDNIKTLIHESWRENPDITIIWPLPEGYIKTLTNGHG